MKTNWRDFVLPSGPYAGKTLLQVYSRDVEYIRRLGASSDKATAKAAKAAIWHKNLVDPLFHGQF